MLEVEVGADVVLGVLYVLRGINVLAAFVAVAVLVPVDFNPSSGFIEVQVFNNRVAFALKTF